MTDPVSRYLSDGLDKVDGWLHPVSAAVIATLADFQRRQDLAGSSGEIGVHHGKLFLILHLLADPDRPSFAADLFENQHLNVDGSGLGDEAQFLRNIDRWAGRRNQVRLFRGDSLDLDPRRIVDACGRARLVSVDGGHTEGCTLNDLKIAEAVAEPHAIVVLDDVFNEFFPEVSLGLQAYVADGRLRPFAITPNKLFLADPRYAGDYRALLRDRWGRRYEKSCTMYGSEVDLYGIRYASYPAWKKMLRDSPLYPPLKRIKRSLEHNA